MTGFAFQPEARYRMPVIFGPSPGPRQQIGGGRHRDPMATVETASVSFLTEAAALQNLLPQGCALDGDPVVTVEIGFMTELAWLAGRGYNTLAVHFPIVYRGVQEQVRGPFLLILWENKADPIITGREELGFAKQFCEIHPPRVQGGVRSYTASWEGHTFMELEVWDLSAPTAKAQASEEAVAPDGLLHYRYVPKVGVPGESEAEGMVLSPAGGRSTTIENMAGEGAVRFIESTWEQIPTLVHIVNTLAKLPVVEQRGATHSRVRRDVELNTQRLVR